MAKRKKPSGIFGVHGISYPVRSTGGEPSVRRGNAGGRGCVGMVAVPVVGSLIAVIMAFRRSH